MRPLSRNFAIELQISLGSYQKQHSLFMRIISRLLNPTIKTIKAFLVVNAEGEEYPTYAFVEGSHDCPKGLLTSLNT